jgi:WD40 repeat protein
MTDTLLRGEHVAVPKVSTPYIGLVPYTEADAAFFFGRDAEKKIVTANLRAARLTLVYGPSGVGKTSLLQAGVVHELREQVALNAADTPARAPFAIAVFRSWRDDPLTALMNEVRLSVQEASGEVELTPWRCGESMVETLRGWTEHARRLLVVLDQFEDYFLYHPVESGDDTFDAQFPLAVNDATVRIHFLVSIREDAWASLDRFEGRIPELFANYVRVEHLDRRGARDAIEGPVDEYNRRLPADSETYSVEPELVSAVLDAAASPSDGATSEAGSAADAIEAPFLQLVMERLWRATIDAGGHTLTLETLERVGGARRIVETHLVDALDRLGPDEQAIAAEAFRYLVTRSRRRVAQSLSDLAEWLGRPEQELAPVLESLTSGESGRILRPVPPPPGRESEGARYELFHDVLAEPILDWRRQFEADRDREAAERHQRAVRRRLVAISAALLVLAGVLGTLALLAFKENRRAQHERSNALASRAIRETAVDPVSGLVLAMQAIHAWNGPEAQSALRGALRTAADVQSVLRGHTDQVERASFSPDGKEVLTASDDGTARIWDATTGRVLSVIDARGGAVLAARFTVDGKHVVTGTEDGGVRLWSASGKPLGKPLRFDTTFFGPELSADGTLVATSGRDGNVRVWSAPAGRLLSVLPSKARESPLTSAAFAGDGKRVLTANADGTARIWDVRTRRLLRVLHVPGGAVTAASFSPDGERVVLATDPGDVATIWDLRKQQKVRLRGHTQRILSAQFSDDGRYVLTAGDTTARIWDASTGNTIAVLRHHGDFVLDASFSRDDRRVVTASSDTTARVWDVRSAGGEVVLSGHHDRVYDASFSPDGRRVVTASRDNTVKVWDAETGAPVGRPLTESGDVLAARYLPDGKRILTAGVEGVMIWRPPGRARLLASSAARDVDARADGTLVITDLDEEAWVGRFPPGPGRALLTPGVVSAVFSPDGTEILTAGDGGVEIWNARTLTRIRRLPYAPSILYSASYSPDGRRIATASSDGTARIFDAATGRQLHVFRGPSAVTSARFSPDGRLLVTSSRDDVVRVSDIATGALKAIFSDHTDTVWNASFSPDGKRVVSASSDGTARIYPLTPIDELLKLARQRLRASVTPQEERAIVAQP